MEKENRIPPPRRRPESDGPAPTALATSAQAAADDGPAGSDARLGQDEEGKTGNGSAAGHGGMGSPEDRPGPGGAGGRVGASSGLPRRVRGMGDGPRPPAQVARPTLPAFLPGAGARGRGGGATPGGAGPGTCGASPPSRPPFGPGLRAGRRASSGAATGWPGTPTRRTGTEAVSPGRVRRAAPRVTSPGRPGPRWLPSTSGPPAGVRHQTRPGTPPPRKFWARTTLVLRSLTEPRGPLRHLN